MHTYTRTNEKWLPRFCCFVAVMTFGTGGVCPFAGLRSRRPPKRPCFSEEAVKALADAV